MDVLVLLAANAGQIVPKEALFEGGHTEGDTSASCGAASDDVVVGHGGSVMTRSHDVDVTGNREDTNRDTEH
jgi:hypothetical protein